jgi:hypothetical protein
MRRLAISLLQSGSVVAVRTNGLMDDPLELVELVERPEPPQLAQVWVLGDRGHPEIDDRRRPHSVSGSGRLLIALIGLRL